MKPRIVYMGTPDFACPALVRLAGRDDVEVKLVVTQPDRAAGRGRQVQAPPVKRIADELALPVYQTASLRTMEQRQRILDLEPDLIVVAAFGLILGKSILELPKHGCVNLHASLLPAYRGASPISAAIGNGDRETGVTLMRMAQGLDTGPMLATNRLVIDDDDTTESLTPRLAIEAADLIDSSLTSLLDGNLVAAPQPPVASLTRPLVKADGWIDWEQPAQVIERHVRAMWAWPRAWTTLSKGSLLQIHQAVVAMEAGSGAPGTVNADNEGLSVQCGEGRLQLVAGQLAGGKALTGAQLATKKELAGEPILGATGRPDTPGPLVIQVVEDDYEAAKPSRTA